MREKEARLGRELEALNKKMKDSYRGVLRWKEKEFLEFIEENAGSVFSLEKLSQEELAALGPVAGVDGSVNRRGGAYPHYVEIYRGLAKSTDGGEEYVEEVYTPLLDESRRDPTTETPPDNRKRILAGTELDVAAEYVRNHPLHILMMDGGLIRYKLDSGAKWEELRALCLEKNVLLLGVIKDIKTNIIGGEAGMYDREILFGNLPYGKGILIDNEKNKKYEEGFSSAFLRPSKGVQVIGLDVPSEQEDRLKDLADLVYSLCPADGRGVPLWLDIVDAEVKISDRYMEAMLEEYLDRDIYMRFFVSERDLRTMR